jgi:tetratricopeptide (TPR) repeat protein
MADRVRDDLESYRGALTWLIDRGRRPKRPHAWGLKYFRLIRSHAEGLQWYEQTLNLPSLPGAAESRVLLGAAGMWWTQGELGRARTALARVLSLAREGGDRETLVHAEHISGHVEHAVGDVDAARARFASSIEGFRALSIPSGTGIALSGMAVLALATGDADHAERLLDEATSVLRHSGPWFLTWALYVRAVLAVRRRNFDEAIALMRESLTRIRELHDKFAFVYALVPLAAAAVSRATTLGGADPGRRRGDRTQRRDGRRQIGAGPREQSEREARARLAPTIGGR